MGHPWAMPKSRGIKTILSDPRATTSGVWPSAACLHQQGVTIGAGMGLPMVHLAQVGIRLWGLAGKCLGTTFRSVEMAIKRNAHIC